MRPVQRDASTVATKVWVVTASVGSFEDFETWNVCIYLDKDHAMQHMKKAQQATDSRWDANTTKRFHNERITYDVYPANLYSHIDEYMEDTGG